MNTWDHLKYLFTYYKLIRNLLCSTLNFCIYHNLDFGIQTSKWNLCNYRASSIDLSQLNVDQLSQQQYYTIGKIITINRVDLNVNMTIFYKIQFESV